MAAADDFLASLARATPAERAAIQQRYDAAVAAGSERVSTVIYGPTGTPTNWTGTRGELDKLLASGTGYTTSPDKANADTNTQLVNEHYHPDTGLWDPGTEPEWARVQAADKDAYLKTLGYQTDGHGNVLGGGGAAQGGPVGNTPVGPGGSAAPGSPSAGTPGGKPATGIDPNAEAKDQQRRSARATITQTLIDLDLVGDTDWAMSLILDDLSPAEILVQLRQRDSYKKRYVAIDKARKNGINPPTEGEVLAYENGFRERLRSRGIPLDPYDTPEEIAEFIAKGLNLQHLDRRIENGFDRVTRSPEARAFFRDIFGADGDAALALFFFDNDRSIPFLEQAAKVGTLGGIGTRYGVRLSAERANRLVEAGVNVDDSGAAFGRLAQLAPLFRETIGETQDLTPEEQGVDAVFGVNDVAETILGQRQQQRVAAFAGGGGVAFGRTGTGLGTAR